VAEDQVTIFTSPACHTPSDHP